MKKYSLKHDKMKGNIKTDLIKAIKKNSIKIGLNLTALASVSTIIWATVKLNQYSNINSNIKEINIESNEVASFIENLENKSDADLSNNEKELLDKYKVLKTLSFNNSNNVNTKEITITNLEDNVGSKNSNETVKKEQKDYLDFSEYLEPIDDIGINKGECEERLTEDLESCFNEKCLKNGFDPEILIGMGKQENGLLSKSTGSAYGMMQIEGVNRNNKYNTHNFITNETEYIDFSKLNLNNYEDNIEAAAVMFQELVQKYNNNINIAIHAYNYGYPIVDNVIKRVMRETGKDKKDVTYSDIEPYLMDIHKNPSKYFSNWGNSTYGDGKYVRRVKQRLRERLVYAIYIVEGNKMLSIYDTSTGEAIKTYIGNSLKSNVYFDKENKKYFKFEDIVNSIKTNNTKAISY